MGAPAFTEAELRRAMKVASEFAAAVDVYPRQGLIRILAPGSGEAMLSVKKSEEGNPCDEAFGL